jgi:hypothetical protein
VFLQMPTPFPEITLSRPASPSDQATALIDAVSVADVGADGVRPMHSLNDAVAKPKMPCLPEMTLRPCACRRSQIVAKIDADLAVIPETRFGSVRANQVALNDAASLYSIIELPEMRLPPPARSRQWISAKDAQTLPIVYMPVGSVPI